MDRMGVEPYSDEWMSEHATNADGVLWEIVREISAGFWLDSFAPNYIAKVIKRGLDNASRKYYVLRNGWVVKPFEIVFRDGVFIYRADVVGGKNDPADGMPVQFIEDDIDKVDYEWDKYVRDTNGNKIKEDYTD